MASVTTGRQLELDWLYGAVGRFFPEAWARLVELGLARLVEFAGQPGAYRLPTDAAPPITGLLAPAWTWLSPAPARTRHCSSPVRT